MHQRQNQLNVFLFKIQFTRKTKICTKNKIKIIQNAQKIRRKNSARKKLTFGRKITKNMFNNEIRKEVVIRKNYQKS